jgi:hypothetical protein
VRRVLLALALLTGSVVVAGCTGMGVYHPLPGWSPGPVIPASVVQGTLRWDGTCVRHEADDGTAWVVVWPTGTRLREDNVPPLLVDDGDRGIASLGDRITLPGTGSPVGSWADERDRLTEEVPRDCRDEALWFGAPLRPG